MNQAQLVNSLSQIRTMVDECLSALRGKSQKLKVPSEHPKKKGAGRTLPERILELRENGFFTQPKTAQETLAKLSPTYSCEPDRVMMALLRLKERRLLRKASKTLNRKKQAAYVW